MHVHAACAVSSVQNVAKLGQGCGKLGKDGSKLGKDGFKSFRIRIPTSSGDNISIKNKAKTLEVSKKGSRFQELKRFSCVFNGNVVPTNSGDTIYESVLNTFSSEIRIAAWENAISGSDFSSVDSWR